MGIATIEILDANFVCIEILLLGQQER
jgi:hypothetical protein